MNCKHPVVPYQTLYYYLPLYNVSIPFISPYYSWSSTLSVPILYIYATHIHTMCMDLHKHKNENLHKNLNVHKSIFTDNIYISLYIIQYKRTVVDKLIPLYTK